HRVNRELTPTQLQPESYSSVVPLTELFRARQDSFKDSAGKKGRTSRLRKRRVARAAPRCACRSGGRSATAIRGALQPRGHPETERSRPGFLRRWNILQRDRRSWPCSQWRLAGRGDSPRRG